MIDVKLMKCEPDDPNRCKANIKGGQCPFLAEPGFENCMMHGANKAIAKAEKIEQSNYNIAKWQKRIHEKANAPGVKSLREEISMLRILMEEEWSACNDSKELLMHSPRISELAKDIDKVLGSCHRIEQSSGQMLDKTLAMNFGAQVIQIIGNYIKDENMLDLIGNDILEALKGL